MICWHYDACVVLDGNPLIEDHLTCIHLDESTNIRCDRVHGLPDSKKESDDNSQVSFAINSKGGDCWHYVSGMVICYRCCT